MIKEEWGTKRTCPECGTRFYDLGKADPAVCIDCGHEWKPEPILKTKQPIIIEEKEEADSEEAAEDILEEDDIDVEGDDLDNISLDDDDDTEVSTMVDTSLSDEE